MKNLNAKYHKSILIKEVTELGPKKGIVVDVTLGGGGHSESLFKNLEDGILISFDRDIDAINHVIQKFRFQKTGDNEYEYIDGNKRWLIRKAQFSQIQEVLLKLNIEKVDMVLADIGISSYQIDTPTRGFSFLDKGLLDMRMDKAQSLTAADLVNGLSKSELVKIFEMYGEEKYAEKIANAIVRERTKKPINSIFNIVEIIKNTVGDFYESSKHPARRVFQALRIAVNDELGELESLCHSLSLVVGKPGIIVILTFHSLERSIVEKHFSNYEKILPTSSEIQQNSRSKSAIGYVIKF